MTTSKVCDSAIYTACTMCDCSEQMACYYDYYATKNTARQLLTKKLHPVNNYYASANICNTSKSIETMTMRLQQHRIFRILGIFSNFGVN